MTARDISLTQNTNVYKQIVTLFGLGISAEDRAIASAYQLATLVRQNESAALARLLDDTGDAQPADVTFAQPELQYWRSAGGEVRGALTQVLDYFRKLKRARMVVVGPAGSGKSILMIRLVRDLAAKIADSTPQAGIRFSVPLYLNASALSMAPSKGYADEHLSTNLDECVVKELVSVYGVRAAQASFLVSNGWILPVLDGLDEMDDPEGPPVRAARLIAALNYSTRTGLRGVVLASREETYQRLISGVAQHGGRSVLQDCTVVEMEPLSFASVRSFLTSRFPDPANPSVAHPRWRVLLEKVDQSAAPWVLALRSPLRLFLIIAGYQRTSSDPSELAEFSNLAELDDHLFSQLIPAKVQQYSQSKFDERSFDPKRWLRCLAIHLQRTEQAGDPGTELSLSDVPLLTGDRKPQWVTLFSVLAVVLTSWLLAASFRSHKFGWDRETIALVFFFLLTVSGSSAQAWSQHELGRLDLRSFTTRIGIRRLRRGFPVSLVASLTAGVILVVALRFGLPSLTWGAISQLGALFVGFNVVLGTTVDMRSNVLPSSSPRALVRQSIADMLLNVLLWTLAILGVGCLQMWIINGELSAQGILITVSLSLIGTSFAVSTTSVPHYLIACLVLSRRGSLPRRLAIFLDWATVAGLIRLTGTSVQFRHREFQAWLSSAEGGRIICKAATDDSRIGDSQ